MQKTMDFGEQVGEEQEVKVESNTKEDKKKVARESRKKKMAVIQKAFEAKAQEDPTFLDRLRTLSESLSVEKALIYGQSGNIKHDENKNKIKVGKTAGYLVKNLGKEPIKYETEEFAPDAEGTWVGTKVDKVLKPGQTAPLNRMYMTKLCSQPEFSFTLANGKLVRGSAIVQEGDVTGELEAYHFNFDGEGMSVHDPKNKIQIELGEGKTDDNGNLLIKPDYEAVFGFMYNEDKKEGKRKAKKSDGYSGQEKAAAYIQELLEKKGI